MCRTGTRPGQPKFCPSFVQFKHTLCSAASCDRKPLTLWRKLFLSTADCAFTITTSLYTNLFTTTTKPTTRHSAWIASNLQAADQQLLCHQSGQKRQPGTTMNDSLPRNCSQNRFSVHCCQACCGKVSAYPQDRMCRTRRFLLHAKTVHVSFNGHTRFVQPVKASTSH